MSGGGNKPPDSVLTAECRECGKKMHPDSDVGGHDGGFPPTCNLCRNQPEHAGDVWEDGVSHSTITGDIKMIQRAIRNRWPIEPEKRKKYVEVLDQVIQNSNNQRDKAKALQTMVDLDKLNLADEQFQDKVGRLDGGSPTERVAIDPVARQAQLDSVIARIATVVEPAAGAVERNPAAIGAGGEDN